MDHSLKCHTRSLEFYPIGKGQLLKDFKKEITAILERELLAMWKMELNRNLHREQLRGYCCNM